MRIAPVLIAAGVLLATAGHTAPAFVTVATKHYRVEAETDRVEAEEFGRVLEAAWPEFRKFFEAEPDLEKGERLRVVFAANRNTWMARLRKDGITPPKAGGYYSPKTRTAYAWRQPTIYFTRCLLIHEATHQFHYLAKTGNRSLPQKWYVEGLAEYLARHYWDGKRLTLGVVPALTLEDSSKAALDALSGGGDLKALAAAANRPVSHAMVGYLATQQRRKFARLAAKLDRGAKSADLVFRTTGGTKKLRTALVDYLAEAQEPWSQLFNEWEGTAPDRFLGTAGRGIVSACRVKGDAKKLTAVLEVPATGGFMGGLLLDYAAKDDYLIALAVSGKHIRVHRRKNGKWIPIDRKPCPAPKAKGRIAFTAVRHGAKVRLIVEGKEIGAWPVTTKVLGLAMQGGRLAFRDVKWE